MVTFCNKAKNDDNCDEDNEDDDDDDDDVKNRLFLTFPISKGDSQVFINYIHLTVRYSDTECF